MKIIIAGASGFIGQSLVKELSKDNEVITVGRGSSSNIVWDPYSQQTNEELLNAVKTADVVINLCGESIAENKWTSLQKQRILDSRIKTGEYLAKHIKLADKKLSLYITSSGISYAYTGTPCGEEAVLDDSFLGEVVNQWEDILVDLKPYCERVVAVRTGVVLDFSGGMLKKLILPFKMGLGGKIGSGQQRMSWIALEDLVGIYKYIIENENINEVINAVAPEIVTNEQFTKCLGKHFKRPTFLPTPIVALELIYGKELVKELLLKDQQIDCKKLKSVGYKFIFSTLEDKIHSK